VRLEPDAFLGRKRPKDVRRRVFTPLVHHLPASTALGGEKMGDDNRNYLSSLVTAARRAGVP